MAEDKVKSHYEYIASEKADGAYEYSRWQKDAHKQAGFSMTESTLMRFVFPYIPSFLRYLEFGPGAGTWTGYFIERNPDAHYTLVDISAEMLKQARKNLKHYEAEIEFIEADFLDFSTENQFDFFMSLRALEYIEDKEAFARQLATLLVPNTLGCIVTKMPHYTRSHLCGRTIPQVHQGQITPKELQSLLIQHGFHVEKVCSATVNLPVFGFPLFNKAIHALLMRIPMNLFSAFFSESYLIIFRKS